MTRIIPSGRWKSSKPTDAGFPDVFAKFLIGAFVALVTAAAFLPVLQNDFVDWDDPEMLLEQSRYRGFGRAELRWMFTTFHMGHYQPLSWLTFALDYAVWGMNPFGFHFTNLLLHSLNGLVFYLVARRLLKSVLPGSAARPSWALDVSAGFAALCFTLHPLRVESVAWATERRDVLSGLFYLSTIYAYVRAQTSPQRSARGWLAGSLCLYLLSLLSKAAAITLPAVLILVDIYPLRRLDWSIRQWMTPEARRVWREKLPFLLLALTFATIAIVGQQQAAALKSLETYGIGARLAQALFGIGFYLWKTFAPVRLSPLYEIPPDYNFWDGRSLIAGAIALLLSGTLFLARARWPAGFAGWLYYLALLAPVLGFAQSGPQLVADRYSYLACLSWAVLAGGFLLLLFRRVAKERHRVPLSTTVVAGALSINIALAYLTWQQCFIWRNTETLWTRVITMDPNGSYGHYNLAREIARTGRYQQAMHHYREALRIRPDDADSHNNLGLLLALTGQSDASMIEFRRAIQIAPTYSRAYYNLGRLLARRGAFDEAEKYLRKALQLSPEEAEVHLALGAVLHRQARADEAESHLRQAVRLRPDSGDAHAALARSLAGQGRNEQAALHYQEALRLFNAHKQRPFSPGRSVGGGGPIDEDQVARPRR